MVLNIMHSNNRNPWQKIDGINLPPAATPELDALSTGLEAAIAESDGRAVELTIISRHPNIYSSTFPSEIVTCRHGNGSEVKLFCKYSADVNNESHGARGGVAYEADVYRYLLQNLNLSSCTFYGLYREPAKEHTGLVLRYLADGVRITKSSDPETLSKAAGWIGQFHALCSRRASSPVLSFLKHYDQEYYRGWARRAQRMAEQAGMRPRWLESVCNRFDGVIEVLCEAPSTIIHGEYYPKNILLQDGLIYPVDWESTAIGSGEIDLATLTEGWPPDEIARLEREYQRARWPEGTPEGFQRCLCAARIYLQLRWLGDQQARLPEYACYLDALRRHAEEMELI
jgi:thiamine kinase-like enzyme